MKDNYYNKRCANSVTSQKANSRDTMSNNTLVDGRRRINNTASIAKNNNASKYWLKQDLDNFSSFSMNKITTIRNN